jgi:23S rRNA pseudouridine2457 synthase
VLIAFHKPYGVLSQFSPDGSANKTLKEFAFPAEVYALGRLDADSEGLLLLSDEAKLNSQLLDPEEKHPRTYWAQVEGQPDQQAITQLCLGPVIQGRKSLPCQARLLDPPPSVAARNPPIRERKSIPTSWLELVLIEGKNRQVRRMTAAVGHPTLRLIRVKIGNFPLAQLRPGQWKVLEAQDQKKIFAKPLP